MSGNPVGWFEIYVQDMDRARSFYETVLGVKLDKLPDSDLNMWTFPMDPNAYGSPGALVCAEGVASGGSGTLVYFNCTDCAVEAARIEKAGGKLERDKMSIGEYGYIALAYDTEGNMLGLHSRK